MVHCLFMGADRRRLATVQVMFRGSETYRTYFVWHRRAEANQSGTVVPARWGVESFTSAETKLVDLRDPAAVKVVTDNFLPAFLKKRPALRREIGGM